MTLNNASDATIIVQGIEGGLITDATGATFNNFGLFDKEDVGQFGFIYLILETNNFGTLRVGKTQNIFFLGHQNSFNNTSTGVMTGEGSFNITSPYTNVGIIRPEGSEAAKLEFVNTFLLSPQSIIELDIFGNASDEYDKLEVLANPFIEGTIDISLHYDAAIDDTFTILTASLGIAGCELPSSIFAEFQSIQYEFEVICTTNDVILKVINKEPALLIEDFEYFNFTSIPNPTQGAFKIQFGTIVFEVELTVSNVLGQTLSKHTVKNSDSYQITIDGAAGIYFITAITDTGKTATHKVIKN